MEIMAIVNVTDDSFCGDGSLDAGVVARRVADVIEEGADLVDLGAESARTNRGVISIDEEIDRLSRVMDELDEQGLSGSRPISINTWRPEVARAVMHRAQVLNDISGLPTPANAEICAACGARLVIMHTQGEPKVRHTHVKYGDVVSEVLAFFESRIRVAEAAGLRRDQIILDPGLDFAKQRDDNLALLRDLKEVVSLGFPVLVPISRKTVIGEVVGQKGPTQREAGTVACLVASALRGASMVRVHNVRAAAQARAAVGRGLSCPLGLRLE